jgi:hypothetical protein
MFEVPMFGSETFSGGASAIAVNASFTDYGGWVDEIK